MRETQYFSEKILVYLVKNEFDILKLNIRLRWSRDIL
jgi:hypothetical protein